IMHGQWQRAAVHRRKADEDICRPWFSFPLWKVLLRFFHPWQPCLSSLLHEEQNRDIYRLSGHSTVEYPEKQFLIFCVKKEFLFLSEFLNRIRLWFLHLLLKVNLHKAFLENYFFPFPFFRLNKQIHLYL